MMRPVPCEYKIVKHKCDSFDGTDLETILRNLKIESVIITGISTEVCCESIARTAFHKDLQVAFISDATATRTNDAQRATLEAVDNYFGRVMTIDELLMEHEETISVSALSKTSKLPIF